MSDSEIFENLFVLELANNHWGRFDRGKRIVREYGAVARHNSVRAAIKLQFRDVARFIHQDFRGNSDVRYVWKTEATRMEVEQLAGLVDEIRHVGCIPMATPFDEASVELCEQLDLPIIKVASSDVNDWPLLERIAATRRPVIVSSGGASEKNLDDVVHFFDKRAIPLAINHCVSLYPSEDHELELNQIDYLKNRYSGHVVGFSSHEQYDWEASMHISYAKGARTWERHIDIDEDGIEVSPYCSLPHQVDTWFKAFNKTREMCGGSSTSRRVIPKRETEYLNALVRGIYAKRDLPVDHPISHETFDRDFYMAIPLKKGQLSVREVMDGEKLTTSITADEALTVNHISGPYGSEESLRRLILERGL